MSLHSRASASVWNVTVSMSPASCFICEHIWFVQHQISDWRLVLWRQHILWWSLTVSSQTLAVLNLLIAGVQLRRISGLRTNLILLGSIRSISLSFFQKTCGVGEASILHSRLTVSPSRALEFNSFWTKVGGWRASWAAHRQCWQGKKQSTFLLISGYSEASWSCSEQATSITYDIKPHGKPTLPSSVSGHTLVHSSIMYGDDLNDEWVHPFFTHQHLVKFIWTNSFTIQVPRHIRHWQTSYLDWIEEVVTLETAEHENPVQISCDSL